MQHKTMGVLHIIYKTL